MCEEKPAASKLILWDPENRTAPLHVSERGGRKVQDHMPFLLDMKLNDLIKSSQDFHMSMTKLLLLRDGSKSDWWLFFLAGNFKNFFF